MPAEVAQNPDDLPPPWAKRRRRPQRTMTVDMVIEELRKSLGMLAPAALELGCAHLSVLQFLANHSRAAAAYKDITQTTTDHVETKMIDRALDGDGQMIKLYLGAKAADRGYSNGSPTGENNGEQVAPISSVVIRAIPHSYYMMKFAGEDQLLNRAQTEMVLTGVTNAALIHDAGPSEPLIIENMV